MGAWTVYPELTEKAEPVAGWVEWGELEKILF